MDRASHPCIGFFPALPLANNLDLGDWIVGTPPEDTPWRSERFRVLVNDLLLSFGKLDFKTGSLVWHRNRGFDGVRPSDDQIRAIGAGVGFAVLDANDALGDDNLNKGHLLATAENAAFFVQPVDETTGDITHVKGGGLRRILVMGPKIGSEPMPLPDATVPIALPLTVSGKLARAIVDLMGKQSGQARRAQIALEWHRAAMTNPEAVTVQQRLIAIKTGFEALFGESDSRSCARKLRAHFETVTANHRDYLPWTGLLWSPGERTDLSRKYRKRNGSENIDTRSEVEDWFMALAEARNSIIHDGVVGHDKFAAPTERPLSRYAGSLFWIGERLLREAIKGFLGPEILLCAPIARRTAWKPVIDDILARISATSTTGTHRVDAPEPVVASADLDAAPPDRDLPQLLTDLGCPTANHVRISKAHGGASASEEVARRMAEEARNKWVAKAGSRSMSITAGERDLLEKGGAEDQMSDYWFPCE